MSQKIIYITFQTETDDSELISRISLAQKSIDEENLLHKNWVINRKPIFSRNATTIGDKNLPFVRDMIETGINIAEDEDIVAISNSDICVLPNITLKIIDLCNKFGSTYSHRYDFKIITELLNTEDDVNKGEKYLGCDFFTFSKKWWIKNKDLFPDMVLGREAWDMIYRRSVKENGGAELDKMTYHQVHSSPWVVYPHLRGNTYNRDLAYHWISVHGGDLIGR
jgi:hypothetical protein